MQQDTTGHLPQGQVVGNRIVYNNSFLNCNYLLCYNRRGKFILAIITLLFLFSTIFGFAFGSSMLGGLMLCCFLAAFLVCIWNFYRLRTQTPTQQAMMQNLNYNQVPPQQVPGPYQPTTCPLLYPPHSQELPPPSQPPHTYPSHPPCAVPYVPPNHLPHLPALKGKADVDQEKQPLTQEESEIPSTTDADSTGDQPADAPPPPYEEAVAASKDQQEKTDK